MVKLARFDVFLISKQPVYYPGQPVAGCLVIDSEKLFEFDRISIAVVGEVYCSFVANELWHRSSETFVCDEQNLIGTEGDRQHHGLPPGRHELAFNFRLPDSCPSSLELPNFDGQHIRYQIIAKIHRNSSVVSSAKRLLTVNDFADTNLSKYQREVAGELIRNVDFFWSDAGQVLLKGRFSRAAYCPGETVNIEGRVENLSSRRIKMVSARLFRRMSILRNDEAVFSHDTEVACKEGWPIEAKTCFSGSLSLRIPPTQPTILNTKSLRISYFIQLEAIVSWSWNVHLVLPVFIGTVPYFEQALQQSSQKIFLELLHKNKIQYAASHQAKETNTASPMHMNVYGDLKYMPVYTFVGELEPHGTLAGRLWKNLSKSGISSSSLFASEKRILLTGEEGIEDDVFT